MTSDRTLPRQVVAQAAAGAVAGAVATLPMSALMLLAQRLGLMGTQPPRRITDGALDAIDVDPPERGRRLLTAVSHVGFGAAAGVPFPLLHRALAPRTPRPLLGVVYALGVWASAYLGWVPAAGLMPPANRDRPGRPASMIAAHVVYGAVLGTATARLLRRSGTESPEGPLP
jgi:hypothetical protein